MRISFYGSSNQPVAISSDGTRIVSGLEDMSVRVWDASTGAELRLDGHSGAVFSVTFLSDGARIVSGSTDNQVCVSGVAAHTNPWKPSSHGNWIMSPNITILIPVGLVPSYGSLIAGYYIENRVLVS